jgi:hypothetical protein
VSRFLSAFGAMAEKNFQFFSAIAPNADKNLDKRND